MKNHIIDRALSTLSQENIEYKLLESHSGLWDEFSSSLNYLPVDYTPSAIKYQIEYHRSHGGDWTDLSIIITSDNKPIAIWPVTFSLVNDEINISSQGHNLLPPLFSRHISRKTEKKTIKNCFSYLRKISTKLKIENIRFCQPYIIENSITAWHFHLLESNTLELNKHELFVDINMPMEEIRRNFRSRYKSLINKAYKLWQHEIFDSRNLNPLVWKSFVDLHLNVAGRKTRSDQTWNFQYEDIIKNRAFLVALYKDNESLVGAALFHFTKDEASYSVGAYDRKLFKDPIGHLAQEIAIKKMTELGVTWYKIGHRPFKQDTPKPTEKEYSIGLFKQGFATHTKRTAILEVNMMEDQK